MSITFACGCGKSFTVADELAGKRVKCQACAAVLTVPDAAAAPAKRVAKAKVSVVEDDVPTKKLKKKKKKKDTGIDREEWDAEEEARQVKAFYARRMVYIIAGAVTIVASGVCLLLFAREQAVGLYVLL